MQKDWSSYLHHQMISRTWHQIAVQSVACVGRSPLWRRNQVPPSASWHLLGIDSHSIRYSRSSWPGKEGDCEGIGHGEHGWRLCEGPIRGCFRAAYERIQRQNLIHSWFLKHTTVRTDEPSDSSHQENLMPETIHYNYFTSSFAAFSLTKLYQKLKQSLECEPKESLQHNFH